MNLLILNAISVGVNRPVDASSDIFRLVLMIVMPLIIIQLILLITALVNLLKKQVRTEDKLLWGAVIVFVATIGPIIYFAVGSSSLDQKAAALEESQERETRLQ